MLNTERVESIKSFIRDCASTDLYSEGLLEMSEEVLNTCADSIHNTNFDVFLKQSSINEIVLMFMLIGYLLKVEQDRYDLDRLYEEE
jgi:hypothetical protein